MEDHLTYARSEDGEGGLHLAWPGLTVLGLT